MTKYDAFRMLIDRDTTFDGKYTKKQFENLFMHHFGAWTPAGVNISLNYCIVNNKARQMTVNIPDIFILHDGKLYKYTSELLEKLNEPYFADLGKVSKEVAIQSFTSDIDNQFDIRPPKNHVLLITNCGGKKLPIRSAAKDLYAGPLHMQLKQLVSRYGPDWYILSGKYLLVRADKEVDTYEKDIRSVKKVGSHILSPMLPVTADLETLISQNHYTHVILALQTVYMSMIDIYALVTKFPKVVFHICGKCSTHALPNIRIYPNSITRDLSQLSKAVQSILIQNLEDTNGSNL